MKSKQRLSGPGRGQFFQVFNFRDPDAKGRSCMILSSFLSTAYLLFTNGIFFTGFLLENGIEMTHIGYITSIPFFCSFFGFFTPVLLGRFKRRKAILTGSRLLSLTLNILGITLVPVLPLSPAAKEIYIVINVFIANFVERLFVSGFSAWHAAFLTEEIRPLYFSYKQIFDGLTSFFTLIVSGMLTDLLSASGESRLPAMMALRFAAYGFAVTEVIVLMLPRETEYKNSAPRLSLLSTITDTLRYHDFLRCALILFLWNFSVQTSTTVYQVYILDDLKLNYTLVSTVDALYGLFIPIILPFWRGYVMKNGWYRALRITTIQACLSYAVNLFVAPGNAVWLHPVYRLIQHSVYVGFSYALANMQYLHLPDTDRTSCLSFYTLTGQAASFSGQLLGTFVASVTGGVMICLPGFTLNNVKIVLLLQSTLNVIVIWYVCKFTGRFIKTKRCSSRCSS